MRDFTRLDIWKRALDYASAMRRLAKTFPRDERFVLTSQLLRAADSIAANIAEGSARGSNGDLERHLRIAAGSAAEVHTFLVLAEQAGYIEDADPLLFELTSTRRMINAFVVKVRDDRRTGG